MMKACLLFICAAMLFISCKKNAIPADVLPKAKMEAVMWDYVSADIYAKNFLASDTSINLDLAISQLQEKVFAQHKIDRKTFNKSYNWYESHSDIFMPMLDSIAAKQSKSLEKERNAGRNLIKQ